MPRKPTRVPKVHSQLACPTESHTHTHTYLITPISRVEPLTVQDLGTSSQVSAMSRCETDPELLGCRREAAEGPGATSLVKRTILVEATGIYGGLRAEPSVRAALLCGASQADEDGPGHDHQSCCGRVRAINPARWSHEHKSSREFGIALGSCQGAPGLTTSYSVGSLPASRRFYHPRAAQGAHSRSILQPWDGERLQLARAECWLAPGSLQ